MQQKIYVCSHCRNVAAKLKDAGVPLLCCGERMRELVPGTTDAAAEKHVPVWRREGDLVTVTVGAAAHPMQEDHSIEWISLQTTQGHQYKQLKPGAAPSARFALCDGDEVEAVFTYCNLHSLWKA